MLGGRLSTFPRWLCSAGTCLDRARTLASVSGSGASQQKQENAISQPLERVSEISLDPSILPLRVPLDAAKGSFTEEQYAASLVHGRSIHHPFFHPRTHNVPVASIHFRSHSPRQLEFFTHFATHAACALGIPVSRPVMLPTKRTLWTVLRSPFAHKKSQENFERRVHKRGIKAWDADPEVVARWVAYLRQHAMGGVGMRITRWERMPLGIGSSHAAGLAAGFGKSPSASERSQRIKTLGEEIVKAETEATEGSVRVSS
ncbi:ribosomal protein S10 [Pluteus cervinus]|uniref:Ribosomal protein S10 n=1 Tax=Pluteus cervinus TaxID=181527 RepID=A0ACD3B1E5_9AGAR|nr:ribosomal protein S10 [Pluteus cervinus]